MMISIIARDSGEDFAIAVSDMCLNGPDIATRSEIAMAAGFNSRNVFSRLYKERYGETPYGHRGSNKGGNESYSGMSNPDCSYHT